MKAQIITENLRTYTGDEKAHFKRIQVWLGQQKAIMSPLGNQHQVEPRKGCRVNLLSGAHENIALFDVEVPLQADWPYGLKQPAMVPHSPRDLCCKHQSSRKEDLRPHSYDVDE